DVEVVRAVERAERPVQIVELGNLDGRDAVAVGGAFDAHRLRQGVADAQLKTVREAAIEARLQRVVLRVADRRHDARLRRSTESCQLPAGGPSADGRPVQLAKSELIDLPRADVRGFGDQSTCELFLN